MALPTSQALGDKPSLDGITYVRESNRPPPRSHEGNKMIDNLASAWQTKFGPKAARSIAAYSGYTNGQTVWLRGRLLSNRPYLGPGQDDSLWDNLKATYRRWYSREISNAPVELRFGDRTHHVTTDGEGYYTAAISLDASAVSDKPVPPETVYAHHEGPDGAVSASHRIFAADEDSNYMVISDVDDTIIQTGITNKLTSARLTFLHNAYTRRPLPGVSMLYRAFNSSSASDAVNPIFYVSNSGWNMHDLLSDFIDFKQLPPGPLLLRDLSFRGVVRREFSDHKITTLMALMERFPTTPVVLIGDSGQHDAELYEHVALAYPSRVKAIYIRDVDPGVDSAYDRQVDKIAKSVRGHNVPFKLVSSSWEIAVHAAEIGILSRGTVDKLSQKLSPSASSLGGVGK